MKIEFNIFPDTGVKQSPVPFLLALGLVAFALLAVVYHKFIAGGPIAGVEYAQTEIVEFQDLSFATQPDGRILITAVPDARLLAEVPADGVSFIRGLVRGLSRDRRFQDLPLDAPFRLVSFANGRLVLTDMATLRSMDLRAFGKGNMREFLTLLPSGQLVAGQTASTADVRKGE
ncbi:MAG: photosynthetic complex assembly protein PuhC [Pseudomonadota bacterium]